MWPSRIVQLLIQTRTAPRGEQRNGEGVTDGILGLGRARQGWRRAGMAMKRVGYGKRQIAKEGPPSTENEGKQSNATMHDIIAGRSPSVTGRDGGPARPLKHAISERGPGVPGPRPIRPGHATLCNSDRPRLAHRWRSRSTHLSHSMGVGGWQGESGVCDAEYGRTEYGGEYFELGRERLTAKDPCPFSSLDRSSTSNLGRRWSASMRHCRIGSARCARLTSSSQVCPPQG